jgi:hypothetical protein
VISSFDQCVFVHIPKVAGQSIESVFLSRAGLTWQQREGMLLKPNSEPSKGPPRLAHLTAQEYLELGYLSAAEFSAMFSFAFVRNPWDRLVSEYVYRQYKCSFEDFIVNCFPTPKDDDYIKGRDLYRHVIPQVDFICDCDGEVMVDFVGKFENIGEDFAAVTEQITGNRLSLPHKNKSSKSPLKKWLGLTKTKHAKKRHYSEYYNNQTREIVAEKYQRDITLFNYEFAPVERK